VTLRAGALLLALALATPAASRPVPPAAPHAFAVVVSPDVDARSVTLSDLRRLFLLDRRFWKPGQPVVTLMPPGGSPQRSYLLGKLCGLDEPGFRQLVLEKMYRGDLDLAPKVVGSDGEAVAFIAASHGAIAIVAADVAEAHGCRVLAVAGKSSGDTGHTLEN
jgi:hypothetical protein